MQHRHQPDSFALQTHNVVPHQSGWSQRALHHEQGGKLATIVFQIQHWETPWRAAPILPKATKNRPDLTNWLEPLAKWCTVFRSWCKSKPGWPIAWKWDLKDWPSCPRLNWGLHYSIVWSNLASPLTFHIFLKINYFGGFSKIIAPIRRDWTVSRTR